MTSPGHSIALTLALSATGEGEKSYAASAPAEEDCSRTMTTDTHLDLVWLWHMHQPDYRDYARDEYALPWTYLHGIKDYTDMADHLERHPEVQAVVNFVPILLAQLADYAAQIATRQLRDPLLRLLAHPTPHTWSEVERDLVLAACFKANHEHMLAPFTPYQRLHELFTATQTLGLTASRYLGGAYFADLVTWYHLAWMGETVRRRHAWLPTLMAQGEGFTLDDRLRILSLIGDELAALPARYRALADRDQIELSTTPYAHPLAPLLLEFDAAREALPGLALPSANAYPGGRERLRSHLSLAVLDHQQRFGHAPVGMWPAEGAISGPALVEFADLGCQWVASGEAVLANTLHQANIPYQREHALYRPWRDASGISVVFRDDKLSDLIGFEYAKWHGHDAARHFIAELEAIRAAAPDTETPLVCIALDGENAWEYYPYNGYYFFSELYSALSRHPMIRTTTLRAALASPGHVARTQNLPRICAGSWVYGSLSTWIGDADKNRAWDLLCAAKTVYDETIEHLAPSDRVEAERLLRACEGSDWFWWFGDYNPATAVASFDQLFRHNLQALYQRLGRPSPAALDRPLSSGGGAPELGGTMRRGGSE